MRTLLLLLLFASFAPSLLAQTGGKLDGHVREAATGDPLPGVNIYITSLERGTVTDADGYYFILNLPPASYSVTASMVGFRSVTVQDVVININRTTTTDFELSEAVLEADEVIVTASRPDIVRDRTASAEVFRMSDVEDNPGIRDITDVLALSADVVDGHFRGGRQGEELYNLAGMSIVNPLSNARAFAPIMSAIEEVEVITSGFSAQYGNAQSGVVNISMREGQGDRWSGSTDFRTRMPGYKHFGASVFDVDSNPYLQLLDSVEDFEAVDPITERPVYDYAYGFTTNYDSLLLPRLAYEAYHQARRDLNRQYDVLWDNSVDLSLGGPLSEHARAFLATRFDRTWSTVPAAEPEITRQAMGNVVFDVGRAMAVRFSGAYDEVHGHNFRGLGSQNYRSYRDWLWDRVIGVNKLRNQALQLGIRWSHALSERTFYEVKVNRLATTYREGTEVIDPTRSREDITDRGMWRHFNPSDFFRNGHTDNRFMSEKTETISFDGSFTSQVTSHHMLLAGVQANSYYFDIDNLLSLSSPAQANYERYSARPYEIGLYAQDKMEFEGMIANLGLRLDMYDQNTDYYVDIFSPLRNPNYDPSQPATGDNQPYDPDLAEREETGLVAHVQPRLGISFPISVSTVFHLNYGSFLQRPAFERTLFRRIARASDVPVRLGNPNLKPERTESYEVGIAQGLGEGFTLDVSGYYKDVKNLIELALFQDNSQREYETFLNRDYADIRGFRIGVNKRRGIIRGSVRYNYSVATGKSSTPFDSPTKLFEQPPEGQEPIDLADPDDIILDFDRTHNVVGTLSMVTPPGYGPRLGGFRPLEAFAISLRSNTRSGRPYGPLNIRRAPMEYNTDLKITKTLPQVLGSSMQLYIEVFNLFNNRIFSYNSVFRNDRNQVKYDAAIAEGVDPNEALRYYDEDAPFLADQRFIIYGNEPRQVYFGLSLDF